AEDGIRDRTVTGVQTCALPISTVRETQRVGWVSLTVVSLAAFSFFAGLGLRGLINGMPTARQAGDRESIYRQYASTKPQVSDPRSEERRAGKEGRPQSGR